MRHTLRILAAVFLLAGLWPALIVSCGGDSPTATTTSGTLAVRQVVSLPTTVTWRKVWGLDASHIYVMGDDGYSYRGNGLTWTKLPTTTAPDRLLLSAWGDRADNVYFAGAILNRDTVTTYEIEDDDTTITTTIYDEPWLTNYNGVAFENVILENAHGSLNDLWGTAADNIYVVGDLGTIMHYDGATWSTMFHGGDDAVELMSVWGADANNVYTCGTSGTFMHYDGTDWKIISAKTSVTLWQAWGPTAGSVYIVGSSGVILHYDGSTVTRMDSPVESSLYAVWGTAENNIYAAGYNGVLLHYDGSSWTETDNKTAYSLLSIWGTGPSDFYVVGQTVLRGAGDLEFDRVSGADNLNDVWVSSTSDASPLRVAVGNNGLTMTSGSGTSWTLVPSNTTDNLNGTWGDAASNLRFAVGDNGTIITFTAGDEEWDDISPVGVPANLNAVAGIDDSTVFVVGDNGTLLKFNYNATSWETITTGIPANLNDVWADLVDGDTVVYAVGDNGWTMHYDGSVWEAAQAPTSENLRGVVGDGSGAAYAVGDNGALIKWSAGSWSQAGAGRAENFRAAWMAAGAGTVFVAAEDGIFLKFNGSTWTSIEDVTTANLNGLFGSGSEDINLVGDYEHLLIYYRQ